MSNEYSPDKERDAAVRAELIESVLTGLNLDEAFDVPEPPDEPAVQGPSGYNRERHLALCRFVSLGLTFEHAAQACGISRPTLHRWRKQYPNLDTDLNTAKWISIGAVARVLQKLMASSDEKVQLQAVTFFLKTQSPEFRDKVQIESELNEDEIAKKVTERIYGNYGAARAKKSQEKNRLDEAESN